jgi:peptidoglycan hydrolase CwlO-like protein
MGALCGKSKGSGHVLGGETAAGERNTTNDTARLVGNDDDDRERRAAAAEARLKRESERGTHGGAISQKLEADKGKTDSDLRASGTTPTGGHNMNWTVG